VLAADVARGPQSSSPDLLTERGGSIVFIADDGRGNALFRLGPPPDITPPTIVCPDDIEVTTTESAGASVTYPPPEVSDDSGAATISTSIASGDVFPVGTTLVTATATDAAGNSARCTFEVVVRLADAKGNGGSGGEGNGGGGGIAETSESGCIAAGRSDASTGTWVLLIASLVSPWSFGRRARRRPRRPRC
jgi:predicted RecA/RadA family phage recombinase